MPAAPDLTDADWLAIEREYCSRSLTNFVRRAWPVFDPTSPLVYGWHIDAICEHLEAITRGEITRLLINVPPGTMKSSLVNVLWPAWEWGPKGLSHYRIISAAHELGLSTRDTRAMRRVITSDWYQSLWPLAIAGDQNQKTYYENDSTGFRQACAVSSMTGKRGHRVLWDDPLSAEDANSQPQREKVIREFRETLPSRYVEPSSSANVIVMQRLHESDPAGFILENDLGYEHLCLPMEFEPDRRCVTSIGFQDPRTQAGELLFPERFTRDVVERDKQVMTDYAWAGQGQQRPSPKGGGDFKPDNIALVDALPPKLNFVRGWDFAASTKKVSDYTATVSLAISDGITYIAHLERGQWGPEHVERRMKQLADTDGNSTLTSYPQDPGQAGKAQAQRMSKLLQGHRFESSTESGDKRTRAGGIAAQVNAGNVRLLNQEGAQDFLDELATFPMGANDDFVDALSRAYNRAIEGSYTLDNL